MPCGTKLSSNKMQVGSHVDTRQTRFQKLNRQKPRYHMVNFVAPFVREIEDP